MAGLEIPDGMGVIVRTAGVGKSTEELQWDLENLMAVWRAFFDNRVIDRPSPFLIYRESNAVVRALRDYLTNEIGEILIDDEQTYKEALEFVEQVMPHNARKLKHYVDPVPLFTVYGSLVDNRSGDPGYGGQGGHGGAGYLDSLIGFTGKGGKGGRGALA